VGVDKNIDINDVIPAAEWPCAITVT